MSKSVITTSVLFLLGLIVFMGLCEAGFRMATYDLTDHQYHTLERSNAWDTIILGPSSSLHGIDPDVFTGRDAYNFSIEGMTFEYMKDWYEYFFVPTGAKPELVIISVDTFNLQQETGRHIYQDASRWTLAQTIRAMLSPDIPTSGTMKNALRMRQGWKLFTRWTSYSYTLSHNGYVAIDEQMTDQEARDTVSPQSVAVTPQNLTYLEELILQIQSQRSDILLVQLPYYRPFFDTDIARQKSGDVIRDIAGKYDITFLDFNNGEYNHLTEDPTIYESRLHMNKKGAQIVSELIDSVLISDF